MIRYYEYIKNGHQEVVRVNWSYQPDWNKVITTTLFWTSPGKRKPVFPNSHGDVGRTYFKKEYRLILKKRAMDIIMMEKL